jgi:hypothetical protein
MELGRMVGANPHEGPDYSITFADATPESIDMGALEMSTERMMRMPRKLTKILACMVDLGDLKRS